ncbi:MULTISPECIES: phytoene desaturase family protein [Kocuria]|uniref:Pyridine nucleotide-disulfide oxidoreductase domain-containing protein 2 n=1 Tax=Kocuria subflava TaxID=1736139 RepID=A0A846TYK6_9MICC|nr:MULTISPECIES: NAD(P)/FAD-dependent oxidoreductase [Kocuria]NKE09365.1 NAD(P)/FAD-dependent oxidoreductase [Kocuria subflava]
MNARAVVVGSGPNGLTAACVLARAGMDVTVAEAQPTVGGAARSADVLGPGTTVDLGAACHPFGAASPAFAALGLQEKGLEWLTPEVAAAHPLEGQAPGLLLQGLDNTTEGLRHATHNDAAAWRALHNGPLNHLPQILSGALGPLLQWPDHPAAMAGFGLRAPWPASMLARLFSTEQAKGLLAGSAAHASFPMSAPLTGAFAVLFNLLGMSNGWPVAKGGTQAIVEALVADLTAHGGRIETGRLVTDTRELGEPEVLMLDLTPRQVLRMRGLKLPARYRKSLSRWSYGTAVHKVDLLLDGPVPWYDSRITQAGTVHVGGTLKEINQAARLAARGTMPERPFVIAAQPTAVDPSRAPEGRHILWAYAQIPHGYRGPESKPNLAGDRLVQQIERFAPGLRERILHRVDHSPRDLEAMNPNLVGGSIGGGALSGLQQVFRPAPRLNPYRTGAPGVYLCSSSTPPGGGVHGMGGYNAATTALRDLT